MSATETMALIEKIAAEGSRNEKQELLAKLLDTEIGRFAVKWAYDPFVTFGIKPIKHASNITEKVEFTVEGVEPLLQKLATRELSGNAAADVIRVALCASTDEGGELLFRILHKDLRCGIAESTIKAVMPDLIPTFAVMRAHHFEEKRIKKWPQVVEPKLDGYRFTFICRNGSGGFFTRSGARASAAEHLVEPMIQAAITAVQDDSNLRAIMDSNNIGQRAGLNFMADGEMMMPGNFNETGALRRKSEVAEDAVFNVFDIMSFSDFDASGVVGEDYMKRRANVEKFVSYADPKSIVKVERYLVNSVAEIYEYYEKFRLRKFEGAMVKNPEGFYEKKKSYQWLKIKAEETEDLPIVGFYNGEAHKEFENTTGGIIVNRNGVNVRIGGGLSKALRDELAELWEEDAKYLGIAPLVGFKPGHAVELDFLRKIDLSDKPHVFELLGRLVEVEFHEVTPDGSLRHPRFIRFRDDKANEASK